MLACEIYETFKSWYCEEHVQTADSKKIEDVNHGHIDFQVVISIFSRFSAKLFKVYVSHLHYTEPFLSIFLQDRSSVSNF